MNWWQFLGGCGLGALIMAAILRPKRIELHMRRDRHRHWTDTR
jgi:hypothetical protein